MYQTGAFWTDDSEKREHCYKLVPRSIAGDAREMILHSFELVYQALGNLGYRFRDSGHNHEKVIVSLNNPIRLKHLKKLEDVFFIDEDDGTDLAFV